MEPNLNTDERMLLLRLKNGEEQALYQLISMYKRSLAKPMLRMLRSPEDTEEMLQELFIRLWENRSDIDVERPLKRYLFRIAENLVYDQLRKKARQKRLITDYLTYIVEAYSHVEEALFDQETKLILANAIAQMPEQRRLVFTLCKIEGKTYEQVSEQLSISVATVNSHITNAHAFLKAYFRTRPDLASVVLVGMFLLHFSYTGADVKKTDVNLFSCYSVG